MYSIYLARDGWQSRIPWATTSDLDAMIPIIDEVEENYEGCDFIAIDEDGNQYMLTSEWEKF